MNKTKAAIRWNRKLGYVVPEPNVKGKEMKFIVLVV